METTTARVIIKRGHSKPLWHGHPWVYAQSVQRIDGQGGPEQFADVMDEDGKFIGRGTLHPNSAIVARLLTRQHDHPINADFFRRRISQALALRQKLGLPNADTNAYRLINSEGDEFAGFVVDVYDRQAVVQFTTHSLYLHAESIIAALRQVLSETMDLQSIVQVDGGSFARQEGVPSQPRVWMGQPQQTACLENGVTYLVTVSAGQKTGLFLDQRQNRKWFGQLARGGHVLDVYCYSAGFALNAAKNGALSVTAIDASKAAIDLAAQNAAANQVDVTLRCEDAFEALATLPKRHFDLVVVDPPKFARSRRELKGALSGYLKLHRAAIRLVRPGGMLCSACCTQLIPTLDLQRSLSAAALAESRTIRLLQVSGPAPDHPTLPSFAEGEYLKFFTCAIT